jgi:hypothetical protein
MPPFVGALGIPQEIAVIDTYVQNHRNKTILNVLL